MSWEIYLVEGPNSALRYCAVQAGTIRFRTETDAERWDAIKTAFARVQRRGGADNDPMLLVAETLSDIDQTLKSR